MKKLLFALLIVLALSSCDREVQFADGSRVMAKEQDVKYSVGDTVLVDCDYGKYSIIDGSMRDTLYVFTLRDSTSVVVDRRLAVVVE